MKSSARYSALAWLVVLAGGGGCSFIDRHETLEPRSVLAKATPADDTINLEIYFAKTVLNDSALNRSLWTQVDEQRIDADLRKLLAQDGIRVGVLGPQAPPELARMLALTDQPIEKPTDGTPLEVDTEPAVTLRRLQARVGRRNEIVSSNRYDELPLIRRSGEQLTGKTYRGADGRFALRGFTDTGGMVRLELVPELHHGEQQPRWVGTDGVLRLEAGKPREVFQELAVAVTLAPGEMLLMTTMPEKSGTLGHYFFTQPASERPAQKLLVLRPSQAASDELFADGGG
jgi:hypothetical protein